MRLQNQPRVQPRQWRLTELQLCRVIGSSRGASASSRLASEPYVAVQIPSVPVDFPHTRNGKLIVHRSPRLLKKARALVEYDAGLGAGQQVLSADQCVAREPTLAQRAPDNRQQSCHRQPVAEHRPRRPRFYIGLRQQRTAGKVDGRGGATNRCHAIPTQVLRRRATVRRLQRCLPIRCRPAHLAADRRGWCASAARNKPESPMRTRSGPTRCRA